jgi:hypothetical protein
MLPSARLTASAPQRRNDFGAESSRPAYSLCTLRTRQSPNEWQHSLPACPLRLWPGWTCTSWTSLKSFTDSFRILPSRAFPSAIASCVLPDGCMQDARYHRACSLPRVSRLPLCRKDRLPTTRRTGCSVMSLDGHVRTLGNVTDPGHSLQCGPLRMGVASDRPDQFARAVLGPLCHVDAAHNAHHVKQVLGIRPSRSRGSDK